MQAFKDSKVYNREQKDWTLGANSHLVERRTLDLVLNFPTDRDIVAIAAKATEQGFLTETEFAQTKRWIAANAAGLTRANINYLDALNDIGDLMETAAFIGGAQSGNSLHYTAIANAIGFTEKSNAPGVEPRFLQAAFDHGLLLQPPRAPNAE